MMEWKMKGKEDLMKEEKDKSDNYEFRKKY